jgi:glycosyltransferase involved in cell wall biosynthesis
MAMSVPSVAFDCAPGVREIVADERNGLLVPRGNTVEFAAALDRLIRDRELRNRLGEQGLVDVARFSSESVVNRWEQVFSYVYR